MSFRLIGHRLLLPSEPAWFDSATLIIGIQSERSLAHSGSGDWQHPKAAMNHELVHFYQTISTPYLLEWAMNWRSHAIAILPGTAEELSGSLPAYLRSLNGNALADAIIAGARPLASARVSPGTYGLSINDLLESHALFLEAKIYGSGGHSPHDFVNFLDRECPSARYRRAYDLFRLWCGDQIAYATFHAAVIGSLCTPHPLERFSELLVECSRLNAADVDGFLRAMALKWNGALAWIQLSDPGHQEIRAYVDRFLTWSSDLGIMDLIVSPECLLSFPYYPSIVYAGDESGKFALLPGLAFAEEGAGLDEGTQESVMVYEYTIAAISHWLFGECVRSGGPTPLMASKYDWLEKLSSSDLELPILVDNWGVGSGGDSALVKDAILKDAERLVKVVSDLNGGEADSLCLSALRRLRLLFVTDSDLEVWQIPEVQVFVQVVSGRIAWLPMLLRYSKPETMFLVWFGSLAPDSVSGLSIDMSHPDVISELQRFLTSLEHVSAGFDVTPCLKATLYPLAR